MTELFFFWFKTNWHLVKGIRCVKDTNILTELEAVPPYMKQLAEAIPSPPRSIDRFQLNMEVERITYSYTCYDFEVGQNVYFRSIVTKHCLGCFRVRCKVDRTRDGLSGSVG